MGSNDHYPVDDPKPLGLDGMLSAIKARCDAATHASDAVIAWHTTREPGCITESSLIIGGVLCRYWHEAIPDGAPFLATAHTDVPRLVRAVRFYEWSIGKAAELSTGVTHRGDVDRLIRFLRESTSKGVAHILSGEEAESDDS